MIFVVERRCWTFSCCNDIRGAWIYFSFSGWILRQRGYRNFLHDAHLYIVDQISQNWIYFLECTVFTCIFLHGIIMGWLRVSDQPDTFTCFGNYDYWALFSQDIRRLYNCVLPRNLAIDANSFCRISTRGNQRTHGCFWSVWVMSDSGFCRILESEIVSCRFFLPPQVFLRNQRWRSCHCGHRSSIFWQSKLKKIVKSCCSTKVICS